MAKYSQLPQKQQKDPCKCRVRQPDRLVQSLLKKPHTRTDTPDSSIIIALPDQGFRYKPGLGAVYKYRDGEPEQNCLEHSRWGKYTAEEYEAMSDLKILGTGSFGDKSTTVIQ